MILVDTSVWIDHFRSAEAAMRTLLVSGQITIHPFVIGELIMGNLTPLDASIAYLSAMPRVDPVSESQLYDCVTKHKLSGTGMGFVDAHLLAAAEQNRGLRIWTRDKRLALHAERVGLPLHSE